MPCFKKYGANREQTGLNLPSRITLRIPSLRVADGKYIAKTITQALGRTPIPSHLRKYPQSIVYVIGVRGVTVGEKLCSTKLKIPEVEVREQLTNPCNCARLAVVHHLPLIDGHIVVRDPSKIHRLFKSEANIVLQSSATPVTPDWWNVKKTFVSSLDKALKGIPQDTRSMGAAYGECLSHLHRAWTVEKEIARWSTKEGAIDEFLKKWRDFVFLPCDKNTAKMLCCCRHQYLKTMSATYEDKKQFECIGTYATVREAQKQATRELELNSGTTCVPDCTHLVIASCTSEEALFLLRPCVQAFDYYNYIALV